MKNNIKINLQEVFFFFILIILSIGFYNVLRPLLADVFWALILVIIFNRPHQFILKKFNNKKSISATLTLLLSVLIIIIPLLFIGFMITQEISSNYQVMKDELVALQENFSKNNIQGFIDQYPILKDNIGTLDFKEISQKINELLGTAAQYTIQLLQSTFTEVTMLIVHIFVMLFLLYFMLRDGDKLIKHLHFISPLKDDDERELLENIKKVTNAVVINTFMLGAIEGTYGGFLFAMLGIPSPFFWGFIMTILSIIPMVGTNAILVPMAIIQFLIGNSTTAILILVLGVGAVLINQNIIRPKLDGNKSGMHTAIILIGSLGGLLWMGIIGFMAGPLITGLFITIWNQFGEKYKENLKIYNAGEDAEN